MFIFLYLQEKYSYVCPDIAKEFAKYDQDPAKWMKHYEGINSITKQKFGVDVGYERFLGPEIFFHPEVICWNFRQPHRWCNGQCAHLKCNKSWVVVLHNTGTILYFLMITINRTSNWVNRIGVVMVSVLASSAVKCGIEPQSDQTKDYKISIYCFSAKHSALRR